MIEMSTEWLCRDCETDVEKMIKVQEAISPRVSETGHVIPGVPCSIYMKQAVCEKCGVLKFVFEYEKAPEAITEPEPELEVIAVLEEAESIDEAIDRIAEIPLETIEEALEEADSFEEDNKLVIEARKGKEAEIARLKAQLEALEK